MRNLKGLNLSDANAYRRHTYAADKGGGAQSRYARAQKKFAASSQLTINYPTRKPLRVATRQRVNLEMCTRACRKVTDTEMT